MTLKACPSCSVISETEKGFCPDCGTNYDRSSATAAATPETARTKGSPVRVLAVLGLVAYLFVWLLPQIFHDYLGWWQTFKFMSGFEALADLPDSLHDWYVYVPMTSLFFALTGYVLLALVIISSKKSS